MKLRLSNAPFIRITIPFILGIIGSIFFNYYSFYIIYIVVVTMLTAIIINYFLNKYIILKDIIFNILTFIVFLFIGFYTSNHKISTLHSYNDTGIFIVKTISSSKIKNNNFKIKVILLSKKSDSKFIALKNKKAMFFIKNDSNNTVPDYGDYLIVKAKIKELEEPKNPFQFNYKKYLFYSGIKNVAFINQHNWKLIKCNKFNIFKLSNNIRNFLLSKLNIIDISEKNKAVISAISLGKKDDINLSTSTSFSNAGVMHILAVSGLHVGIVFLILIILFKPLLKLKNGKLITYTSIILILWIYAFVTGLTPSVVRSVLMFSLVSVGKAFNRQTNIYNIIFASAFILLIINPFLIMQIGFQLSYLAVIGIVFFQPRIASVINTNNIILKYLWDIVSVSIAAQIATAPLTILYFHKFPVYFIFSNIVVMFNVSVILFLSFMFFISFYIPFLNKFIAYLLNITTNILNNSIEQINKLPYPIIDNINWNILLTIISYVIIVLLIFYLISRKKFLFSGIIIFITILIIMLSYSLHKNRCNTEICFFHIRNHNIIGLTHNNKTTLIIDKKYKELGTDIKQKINNYLVKIGSRIVQIRTIKDSLRTKNILLKNNFLKFFNKTFYIYDGNKMFNSSYACSNGTYLCKKININYLVIQKYNYKEFKNLISSFNIKNIVLTPILYPRNIENINNNLRKSNNFKIIDLNKKAYILNIK